MPVNAAQLAAARSLTVAYDGDDHLVGRPDLGVFVEVPHPAAVLIEALREGESLAEATRRASAVAGEEVDGEDFMAGLAEIGLLDSAPGTASPGGARSGVRWIEWIGQQSAARLFGRVAWTGYTAAAAFVVAVLLLRPDLRPSYDDVWFLADPVLSVLAFVPVVTLLAMLHEVWHWLAGRALGVPAAFRISYRGVYLVFETDLTHLVTLPRRRRYGPFLAGMAIDAVVLAAALGCRMLYRSDLVPVPPALDRLLGVVVFALCFSTSWQVAGVFLRTDMYAVLANALRCHNLYRVTWLTTKDRLLALSPSERDELASAHPRDRAVARWFGLVYVAGLLGLIWFFMAVNLPALVGLGAWVLGNLRHAAPTSATFWTCVAALVYLAAVWGAPPLLALRERRLRRKGRLL